MPPIRSAVGGSTIGLKMALLYLAQGRYAEAEPFARRALELAEQAFGASHPTTATVTGSESANPHQ